MGFGMFGFDATFGIFGILFSLVFVAMFAVIIVSLIKSISQWNKNNHSPRLTVPATVVAKRTNVSSHHHHSHNGTGMDHTTIPPPTM